MYMFKNDALKQSTKNKRKLIPSDYDSRISDVLAGLPDEIPETETSEVKIVRSRFDIKPFVSAAAVFALAAACVFTYPKFSQSAFDKDDDSNSGTDGSMTQAVTSVTAVSSAETTSVSSGISSASETSVSTEKETVQSVSDDTLYISSDTFISSYIKSENPEYIPQHEAVTVPSVTMPSAETHNHETELISVPESVLSEPVKPTVTEIPAAVTEAAAATEVRVTKPVPPAPLENPEKPEETASHPVPPAPVPPDNRENPPQEPELPFGRDEEGHPVHPARKEIEMHIIPPAHDAVHNLHEHISEMPEISD